MDIEVDDVDVEDVLVLADELDMLEDDVDVEDVLVDDVEWTMCIWKNRGPGTYNDNDIDVEASM